MCLFDLYSIVAAIASHKPISEASEIEDFKIAQMASDILFMVDGSKITFRKGIIEKPKITPSLLVQAFEFSPYLLFSCDKGYWSVTEASSHDEYVRLLNFVRDMRTIRIGVVNINGYSSDKGVSKIETIHGTKVVSF